MFRRFQRSLRRQPITPRKNSELFFTPVQRRNLRLIFADTRLLVLWYISVASLQNPAQTCWLGVAKGMICGKLWVFAAQAAI